jgi:hypothetical protein
MLTVTALSFWFLGAFGEPAHTTAAGRKCPAISKSIDVLAKR